MNISKQSDVGHPHAARRRKVFHAALPVADVENAIPSSLVAATLHAHDSAFVSDFSMEHSSRGGEVSAVVIQTDCEIEVDAVEQTQNT